ncbi:hypothetical protein PCANB_001655 [Pneumocystis canis]|nr:hypothetical protein PCK1_001672 [Pneumocystis canis]KAG5436902.1 hypothetical protein PCANB_001655 [Pneumocystis canis]
MFLCVECAHPVESLYTEYSKNNFRLTQCPLCKGFADKYVEFDYVILAIDVMLIKPQVYRHLLFNQLGTQDDCFNSYVIRFWLLLILFDVYLIWLRIKRQSGQDLQLSTSSQTILPDIIQCLYLLLLCLLETIFFHWIPRILARQWPNALSTAIFVSSSARLLPVLMVIWSYDTPIANQIIEWVVLYSNFEAIKIRLNCGNMKAFILIFSGVLSKALVFHLILKHVFDIQLATHLQNRWILWSFLGQKGLKTLLKIVKNKQFKIKTLNNIFYEQPTDYRASIKYNIQVAQELIKQVWTQEKLRPPSFSEIERTYRTFPQYLNISYFRSLSQEELIRLGIYLIEAYGFFKLGEIIGRRHLIGYKI